MFFPGEVDFCILSILYYPSMYLSFSHQPVVNAVASNLYCMYMFYFLMFISSSMWQIKDLENFFANILKIYLFIIVWVHSLPWMGVWLHGRQEYFVTGSQAYMCPFSWMAHCVREDLSGIVYHAHFWRLHLLDWWHLLFFHMILGLYFWITLLKMFHHV